MRIQIEATDKMVELNGVACRLWEGTTESGIPCKVFVHRLAVKNGQDQSQFERELVEQVPPARPELVPLGEVLT